MFLNIVLVYKMTKENLKLKPTFEKIQIGVDRL